MLAKGVFWGSLAAIAWTHVGYPAAAAALARVRRREVRKGAVTPDVTVIVAAHDEDDVIERRLENLLSLDYPPERLSILVASDASTDGTEAKVEALAAREGRVHLLRCPRGGKLAALNRAVAEVRTEVVAFSDANCVWERDALTKLVASFADPEVSYVCGRLRLESADGDNREGVYWRYELWLREQESALGSITAGNGAIYAVRRADWVAQPYGQDAVLPALMVKRGKRAVYEPDAVAREKPPSELEDEYGRKARMSTWAWYQLLEGRSLAGVDPLFAAQFISHRVLRYSSGLLHVGLLASSLGLARRGRPYAATAAGQAAWLALALAGRRRVAVPGAALAYYYFLVTSGTLVGLARYLRDGPPRVWEKAEGTR